MERSSFFQSIARVLRELARKLKPFVKVMKDEHTRTELLGYIDSLFKAATSNFQQPPCPTKAIEPEMVASVLLWHFLLLIHPHAERFCG